MLNSPPVCRDVSIEQGFVLMRDESPIVCMRQIAVHHAKCVIQAGLLSSLTDSNIQV